MCAVPGFETRTSDTVIEGTFPYRLHYLTKNDRLMQDFDPEQWTRLFGEQTLSVFIQAISIAPLQVQYYSEVLLTQHGYCAGISRRSATGNCEWRTCLTWWLQRGSNPWPFGRKASTLPMCHLHPMFCSWTDRLIWFIPNEAYLINGLLKKIMCPSK